MAIVSDVVLNFNKIYNTIVEMLIDRGYPEEILMDTYYNMDLEQFQEFIRDNKLNIKLKHKNENKYVVVYFFGINNLLKMKGDIGKMKKDDINLLVSDIKSTMEDEINYDIIIILKEPPHNTIINKISELHSSNNIDEKERRLHIEYFIHDELKYNVSRHDLVPKHSKCSKEEIDKILQKYDIKISALPNISHDDPQARYLGLRKGDICKIERKSPTTGIYVYYRVVV